MRPRSNTMRWRPRVAISVAALVAVAGLLAACASNATSTSTGSSTAASRGSVSTDAGLASGQAPAASPSAKSVDAGASPASLVKLIVVNKTLRIETTSVDRTISKVRALAARYGGDVADLQVSTKSDQTVTAPTPDTSSGSSSVSSPSGALQAYVVVRVPVAQYAAFTAQASGLGKVLFQSESAQDVTQKHVDLQARLDNLRSEESSLRVMFRRAGSVKDMLLVEQELARVQGDIESLQGQIDYLENQAALATITIELAEPQAIVSPGGTDWGVGAAVTKSVRAFVDTLNILIELVGPLLALLLFIVVPIGLVVWVVTLVRRRLRSGRPIVGASAKARETRD